MRTTCLTAIAYALGECEFSYREAPGFATLCRDYAMPDMPALFGWGMYRRTHRPLLDLAVESVRATLDRSEMSGSDIDAVIVCSANLHSDDSLSYTALLREAGLTRALPIGLTWTDCTMLLTGLALARGLVQGQFGNVLVVSANRIEDEKFRFQPYALFSDGAASCIVTSQVSRGFEILGDQAMSRWECAGGGSDARDTDLYADVHRLLMRRLGLRTEELERVLPNNLFLPVLKIKEGCLGIAGRQLFLNNVAAIGHCFAADSLINLHDYAASRSGGDPGRLMLTANADGLRSQMIVRPID